MPVSAHHRTEVLRPVVADESDAITTIDAKDDEVSAAHFAPRIPHAENTAAQSTGDVPVPQKPKVDTPTPHKKHDEEKDKHESEAKEEILFHDDFSQSFEAGIREEKWNYFSWAPFVADDGIETVDNGVLTVRSSGTNPTTRAPAFTKTVAPTNAKGSLDHHKWLVYTNAFNDQTKFPGFASVAGKELVCEAWMRGQTFGTDAHPFGHAVVDAHDPRLASFALKAFDPETSIGFAFVLTNDKIYALYERLPHARATLGNYAAFSYIIEIGTRVPSNFHNLELAYDRARGAVRWYIDGKERYKVGNIGKHLSDQFLTVDNGGEQPSLPIVLNQLNCGMGHSTLLDGFLPTQTALVRLSSDTNFYSHPIAKGLLTFLDEVSAPQSRLFGQGVQTQVKRFNVKYVNKTY